MRVPRCSLSPPERSLVGLCATLLLLAACFLPPLTAAQDRAPGEQQGEETGFLRVQLHVQGEVYEEPFYLIPGRPDSTAYRLTAQDSLRLPVGEHEITVATATAPDARITASIRPGETVRKAVYLSAASSPEVYRRQSSYPVRVTASNVLVRTEDDARVYLGSELQGSGEQLLNLSPGVHRIRVVHPDIGTREKVVDIGPDETLRMQKVALYFRPDRRRARRLGLLPGASQFYSREHVKGGLLVASFASAVGLAALQHRHFQQQNATYMTMRDQYRQAGSEETAQRLATETRAEYDAAQRLYQQRNTLIAAAIGLYAASFWDSRRPPAHGYRRAEEQRVRFTIDGRAVRFRIQF